MNAHVGDLLMLAVTVMLVLFRIYVLVHRLWRMPLEHGPRFFRNVEVPEGFHEGPVASWLKRYRAIILTEHLIEAAIVATILGTHRLDLGRRQRDRFRRHDHRPRALGAAWTGYGRKRTVESSRCVRAAPARRPSFLAHGIAVGGNHGVELGRACHTW